MTPNEARKILGVSDKATRAEIGRAFRRFARANHPDMHSGAAVANVRMARASEARDLLLAKACDPLPTRSSVERGVNKGNPKRASDVASSSVHSEPARTSTRVCWPQPPIARSAFFEERGYDVRPTDGRTSFRVIRRGVLRFVLHRHPDNPEILYCRDVTGAVSRIDGFQYFVDGGKEVAPLRIDERVGGE